MVTHTEGFRWSGASTVIVRARCLSHHRLILFQIRVVRLAVVDNNIIGGIVAGKFDAADIVLYAFNPVENSLYGVRRVLGAVSSSYRLSSNPNL